MPPSSTAALHKAGWPLERQVVPFFWLEAFRPVMALSLLSLKKGIPWRSLSFLIGNQNLGYWGISGTSWSRFSHCVYERENGKEKETGYSVQHLIWLCNSTAACSWRVFLTSPRTTEDAKPLYILSVPGSPDKLLAKQSTCPQNPFGVLMSVERIVGSRSNFLAFVADCDKKKVSFLDLQWCQGCMQAGECSQWSFLGALGLWKVILLVLK